MERVCQACGESTATPVLVECEAVVRTGLLRRPRRVVIVSEWLCVECALAFGEIGARVDYDGT